MVDERWSEQGVLWVGLEAAEEIRERGESISQFVNFYSKKEM